MISPQDIAAKTDNTEYKFDHACRQIPILNQWVNEKQILYDHSVAVLRCSFHYSWLVRLMTLKSIHDAFYEYTRHATEMGEFHLTLMGSFFYKMSNDNGAELIY